MSGSAAPAWQVVDNNLNDRWLFGCSGLFQRLVKVLCEAQPAAVQRSALNRIDAVQPDGGGDALRSRVGVTLVTDTTYF